MLLVVAKRMYSDTGPIFLRGFYLDVGFDRVEEPTPEDKNTFYSRLEDRMQILTAVVAGRVANVLCYHMCTCSGIVCQFLSWLSRCYLRSCQSADSIVWHKN